MARGQINHIVAAIATGDVKDTAQVRITARGSGSNVLIYTAETGQTLLPNPVPTSSANSNTPGRIPGWLEEGSYTLAVSGPGIVSYTRAIEIVHGAAIGRVAPNAVTSAALPSNAVTTAKIADGAVTVSVVADAAVSSAKLATSAVSTRVLANSSVTPAQLADSSIDVRTLATDSVTINQMADASVGTSELISGSVGTNQVSSGAIGSTALGDAAVTGAKIADDQITNAKIAPGAVLRSHLHASTLPVGHIIMLPYTLSDPNWLPCDGSMTVLRDSPLGIKLAGRYGPGNGSTTYDLPDFRGRVPTGLGTHDAVNTLGDNEGMTLTSARQPIHGHTASTASIPSSGAHTHQYGYGIKTGAYCWRWEPAPDVQLVNHSSHSTSTSGPHSHGLSGKWGVNNSLDTLPFLVLNFYIKQG